MCHVTRAQAVLNTTKQSITFDIAHNRYLCKKRWFSLPKQLTFGSPLNALGPPSKPRTPIQNPCTFPQKNANCFELACNSSGSFTPGTVYIKTKNNRCAYALTVPMHSSGAVTAYHWNKNCWKLAQPIH